MADDPNAERVSPLSALVRRARARVTAAAASARRMLARPIGDHDPMVAETSASDGAAADDQGETVPSPLGAASVGALGRAVEHWRLILVVVGVVVQVVIAFVAWRIRVRRRRRTLIDLLREAAPP